MLIERLARNTRPSANLFERELLDRTVHRMQDLNLGFKIRRWNNDLDPHDCLPPLPRPIIRHPDHFAKTRSRQSIAVRNFGPLPFFSAAFRSSKYAPTYPTGPDANWAVVSSPHRLGDAFLANANKGNVPYT